MRYLSIIPVQGERERQDFAKAAAFFPLVGLLFGLVLFVSSGLFLLIFPEQITNILVILVLIILSGARHLEGLSNSIDSVFEAKGRVLSVVAIVFVLLFKVYLLNALASDIRTWIIIVLPLLSRFSTPLSAALFGSTKGEQSARTSEIIGFKELLIASITTVIVLAIFFKLASIVLLFGVVMFVALASFLLSRKAGSMTDDSYSALIELTEVWTLLLAVAFP